MPAARVRRLLLALLCLIAGTAACTSTRANSRAGAVRTDTNGSAYHLPSLLALDTTARTVTLPLFRGTVGTHTVWYVVTESSDRADATARGVTWSPRLAALANTRAAQRVTVSGTVIRYPAGIDASPESRIRPNPDSAFPPLEATPGSVADPFYSPFVQLPNGVIINAPIIATEFQAIDRVLALDPIRMTVIIRISRGYGEGRDVWYFSPDASDPAVAALEGATFAPILSEVPVAEARTGLVAITNGATGRATPERQGLRSALLDHEAPLNILQHIPDGSAVRPLYSPAWDLHLATWTTNAISTGQRDKLLSWREVARAFTAGSLTSGALGVPDPTLQGLSSVRVVINCPVVAIFTRERE